MAFTYVLDFQYTPGKGGGRWAAMAWSNYLSFMGTQWYLVGFGFWALQLSSWSIFLSFIIRDVREAQI